MRSIPIPVATAFFLVLIALSCQKTNKAGASNAISGNYKFINMNVHSQAITSISGDSVVAFANYITTANAGTIKFTTDSMMVNGLAYTVDTNSMAIYFVNGKPADTIYTPFNGSLPATSMNVGYTLVNSDSLYFPNGGIIPAGMGTMSQGSGATFVKIGDTLKMTTMARDTSNGEIQMGTAVITLLKQ